MSEYKPGTVAKATVLGEDVRVFRHTHGWCTDDPSTYHPDDAKGEVTDIRPVVVLDPEHDAERLQDLYTVAVGKGLSGLSMLAALTEFVKPPRIPEPGLWGVVQAPTETNHTSRKWVHYGTGWRDAFGGYAAWSDLVDPTLVREGVES